MDPCLLYFYAVFKNLSEQRRDLPSFAEVYRALPNLFCLKADCGLGEVLSSDRSWRGGRVCALGSGGGAARRVGHSSQTVLLCSLNNSEQLRKLRVGTLLHSLVYNIS